MNTTTDRRLLTIFTPTYNRRTLLERLYLSLEKQTIRDFEWVVIDDGSTDNTEEYLEGISRTASFPVRYAAVQRGGKHRALNIGARMADGVWLFIMDSDDYLLEDALEKYWPILLAHADDPKCATASFLCMTPDRTTVGDEFDEDDPPVRYADIWEKGITGDKADAIKLTALKAIGFPEFPGETYLAPSAFFLPVSLEYTGIFKNIRGYICEYLPGGLSHRSLQNRVQSPEGAKFVYELEYTLFRRTSRRIRGATNYWRFYFHGNRRARSSLVPKRYVPLGLVMYLSDRMWRLRRV